MAISEDEIKAIKDELKWINLTEYSTGREKKKGIYAILVPMGCAVTAGILFTGLYYLRKGDSRKQQTFMRLRVLSQGITAGLAAIGFFTMTSPKSIK